MNQVTYIQLCAAIAATHRVGRHTHDIGRHFKHILGRCPAVHAGWGPRRRHVNFSQRPSRPKCALSMAGMLQLHALTRAATGLHHADESRGCLRKALSSGLREFVCCRGAQRQHLQVHAAPLPVALVPNVSFLFFSAARSWKRRVSCSTTSPSLSPQQPGRRSICCSVSMPTTCFLLLTHHFLILKQHQHRPHSLRPPGPPRPRPSRSHRQLCCGRQTRRAPAPKSSGAPTSKKRCVFSQRSLDYLMASTLQLSPLHLLPLLRTQPQRRRRLFRFCVLLVLAFRRQPRCPAPPNFSP